MHTAQIIPFPPRRAPGERLRAAASGLQAAVEEQRGSVRAWREAMAELGRSVGSLHDSLRLYRGTLGELGQAVAALREEAETLQRWAGRAGC
jgi:chromosome segregation ATPase